MSAPIDCLPRCCPTVQSVNVPGVDGSNGADGSAGAAGQNAFTLVAAPGFNVPASPGGSVTIPVNNSQWMALGQTVVVDGPATFTVTALPTTISATLSWTKAASDVAGLTAIAAGAKVSPGGVPGTLGGAVNKSSPVNPVGTMSLVGVMMGLAGSMTPTFSGRFFISITGMIGNDTVGDGASVQIRFGTGGAPANAAALTGTTLGQLKNMVPSSAAAVTKSISGFSLGYIVTGLIVDTAYWIDVGLKAVTAGTANIYDVDIVAIEL